MYNIVHYTLYICFIATQNLHAGDNIIQNLESDCTDETQQEMIAVGIVAGKPDIFTGHIWVIRDLALFNIRTDQ